MKAASVVPRLDLRPLIMYEEGCHTQPHSATLRTSHCGHKPGSIAHHRANTVQNSYETRFTQQASPGKTKLENWRSCDPNFLSIFSYIVEILDNWRSCDPNFLSIFSYIVEILDNWRSCDPNFLSIFSYIVEILDNWRSCDPNFLSIFSYIVEILDNWRSCDPNFLSIFSYTVEILDSNLFGCSLSRLPVGVAINFEMACCGHTRMLQIALQVNRIVSAREWALQCLLRARQCCSRRTRHVTRLCAHGLGDGADAAVVEGAPLVHRQAGWGEGWRDGPAQRRVLTQHWRSLSTKTVTVTLFHARFNAIIYSFIPQGNTLDKDNCHYSHPNSKKTLTFAPTIPLHATGAVSGKRVRGS
ncbi:hypothetical protein RRG08_000039 [Elysia crispata]|uniref:Uncharacterized protein n=1 Tax=Elysia crispata TaxID=231223 RepID=A0AAE0Y6B8_9GAST|nr:hypothetical protein RRG08_000039 [Elysia crispata]